MIRKDGSRWTRTVYGIEEWTPALHLVVWAGIPFFLLLLTIGQFHALQGWEVGRGTATGYVTAIDYSGPVWPDWTAYLKTDAESTQEDAYCVRDEGLVGQLRVIAEKKTRVEVRYVSYFYTDFDWCRGTNDVIVSFIHTPLPSVAPERDG